MLKVAALMRAAPDVIEIDLNPVRVYRGARAPARSTR